MDRRARKMMPPVRFPACLVVIAFVLVFVGCGAEPIATTEGGPSSGSGSGSGGSSGSPTGSSGGSGSEDASGSSNGSSASGGGSGSSDGSSAGSSGGSGPDGGKPDASTAEGGRLIDASIDRAASDGGGTACGPRICPSGQFCCDPLCGLCASLGTLCVQECDGGIHDASLTGCKRVSGSDSQCTTAGLPHYYSCTLVNPPSECMIGALGDTFTDACCP
jgi:hypothetical protein